MGKSYYLLQGTITGVMGAFSSYRVCRAHTTITQVKKKRSLGKNTGEKSEYKRYCIAFN